MKILIVEDDKDLSAVLKDSLTAMTYTVETAFDGGEGLFLAKNYEYDAIVLDYSLPKKNGLAVCKEIRAAKKSTPILFLSATETVDTKVSALDTGADDYMTKPFSLVELNARLQALHRRPDITRQTILTIYDLTLDLNTKVVMRNGQKVHLTSKEFSVLEYLMQRKGTIVSRALIMEYVWTADVDIFSNAVESHIRNIRRKINRPDTPDMIVNVPGRGYMMPE
ncbi:MAG: response regulator transcription factor [Candidatus Pacebacteria bacterium]|nr:response regulator transcription factor [Candidatus Paceibacterota bacterium]